MTETLKLGAGALATVQVARRPILTADDQHTPLGYELLFRDSGGLFSAFTEVDEFRATSEVVSHSVLTLGVDTVVGDHLAFVRFPLAQFVDSTPLLMPPDQSTLELGRDVWASRNRDAVLARCQEYRRRGYRIALADFFWTASCQPLLAIADFVKVDLRGKDLEEIEATLAPIREHGCAVIATSVDTAEDRDHVVAAGVDYVQGFFFSSARVIEGRELPGHKVAYLQLQRLAYAEDMDFAQVARVIKTDVALSFKLLRFVNSAHFGFRGRIESLERALVMLGIENVRRWVSVATVSGLSDPGPRELALVCAIRARFCESLGTRLGVATPHACFSLGMFSLIDVMLGRSMADALADVSMDPEVTDALQGEPGALQDLLDIVVAYERGQWDTVSAIAEQHRWPETELIGLYLDAIEWGREFFGSTAMAA